MVVDIEASYFSFETMHMCKHMSLTFYTRDFGF
jgi:hypothetical protein